MTFGILFLASSVLSIFPVVSTSTPLTFPELIPPILCGGLACLWLWLLWLPLQKRRYEIMKDNPMHRRELRAELLKKTDEYKRYNKAECIGLVLLVVFFCIVMTENFS